MQRHFSNLIVHRRTMRRFMAAALVLAACSMACDRSLSADTKPVAGPSRSPVFTSSPVTEISVSENYAYPCVAEQTDSGTPVKLALRKAPKGMTIGKDGVVKWKPRLEDVGDHAVSIVAGEAKASEAVQSYFLTVTAPWTEKSKVRTLHYNNAGEAKRACRVAILMINTLPETVADNPKTPRLEFYTPEKLGHLFFHHPDGTSSFLREASHDRVALTGTVVGWLNAPQKGVGADDITRDIELYCGLAQQHMDFLQYDVFVIHALAEGAGQQTGWLYPQQTLKTPRGVIKNIGIVWMINSAVFDAAPLMTSNWSSGEAILPTTSWAHELIHTFGIAGHCNSLDCGDKSLCSPFAKDAINAYGGVFSVMGEHAFACHPDVLMKAKLGWVEKRQVPTITKSGTSEIYPLETKDTNVKGLLIPMSPGIANESGEVVFDAMAVEYREPIGFDRYLERLDGSPFLKTYKPEGKVDRKGVIVYLKYKSDDTDGTVLVDANPATPFNADRGIKLNGNVGKFADAILGVDKTMTYGNVSLTPVGVTEKGAMRVKVEIGEQRNSPSEF
jgi:hypothetical protein